MPIVFQARIERIDLQNNPRVLYVFGDNDQRVGKGGLAAECRGEPNAVGVRTKKTPSMDPTAFFTDNEFEENCAKISDDLEEVFMRLTEGRIVVFPAEPLGSGLARLKDKAPRTYDFLKGVVEELAKMP